MNGKQYFKILEFSNQVGKHFNTVDKWFKEMENRKLHYINRTEDTQEKFYDLLDLEIARYIVSKREEGWSLNAIFNDLPDHFTLREFPIDKSPVGSELQVIDIEALKNELSRTYEQIAAVKIEEAKQEILISLKEENEATREELIKALPQPVDPMAERQKRLDEALTLHTIQAQLRKEALKKWNEKPVGERMRKVLLWIKEEDISAKDNFIRAYVDEHLADRLKKEYE